MFKSISSDWTSPSNNYIALMCEGSAARSRSERLAVLEYSSRESRSSAMASRSLAASLALAIVLGFAGLASGQDRPRPDPKSTPAADKPGPPQDLPAADKPGPPQDK